LKIHVPNGTSLIDCFNGCHCKQQQNNTAAAIVVLHCEMY